LSLVIIRHNFWSSQFGKNSFFGFIRGRLSSLPRHGFVGSQNRLGFVGGCRACRDTKFQVWLSQAFKIGYIFSAKVLVNFISALGCRTCRDIGRVFLQRFWHVVFWFLLKIKVRAIILSVGCRVYRDIYGGGSGFQSASLAQKPANKACT
jgi:hypothetical protein